VDFLRLLGSGIPPGSNGPNGLIGDGNGCRLFRRNPIQTFSDLTFHNIKGLALVALFQQFSHTEDGFQTGGRSGSDFQVNQFIGFAENMPPLRVPDDDIGAAAVNQHFTTDFAGESPVLLKIDILSAQLDL